MPRALRVTSRFGSSSFAQRASHPSHESLTTRGDEICAEDLAVTEHPSNWRTAEAASATILGVSFPGNVSMACRESNTRSNELFLPNGPGWHSLGHVHPYPAQGDRPASDPEEVTAQVNSVPAPASTAEALAMLHTAMGYLAAADPTAMSAQAQAECLHTLEQLDAVETAARARILAAFTSGHGYSDDADYSPASWLIHRTRVTKGAARGHLGWARRAAAHPQVVAALAGGTVLTESIARLICGWTDKLPESCRETADDILVAAARAGARKDDLAALAAEIYARSLPDSEDDPEPDFEDRKLRVETTFAGAGVLSGDLTPEATAVVTAVLDALSAPRGAEDTRTKDQRYHDALQDAMRRLVASGLLPERAGQPVKVWAHVSLAELRALDDGSVLQQEWIGEMAVRWAARRAAASQAGSDGAAWLDGKAARAMACDAAVIPVVTGGIDPGALDDLVGLCLQYRRPRPPLRRRAGRRRACRRPARPDGRPRPAPGPPGRGSAARGPVGGRRSPRARRRRPLPVRPAAPDRARRGHAPARDHSHRRQPGLRPGRAGLVPADPAGRGPAGRAQPAAGRRAQRRDPRRDPPRGHPARPALPLGQAAATSPPRPAKSTM